MSSSLQLPEEFLTRITGQLGYEVNNFVAAFNTPSTTSVLDNPLKPSHNSLPIEMRVPWNQDGYFLKRRPEFVFDPSFHAGAYYVMESSSMLLAEALKSIKIQSDTPVILDLCAAPGGKSMVALNHLGGEGILISNEVNRKRFGVLNENIAKWGHGNTITSNLDPSRIFLDEVCDCVIVDAPCSGEGLFRKTPKSIDEWSKANAEHCTLRQRRILGEAMRLVKPNGYLIYSTCTYNPDENIENAAWVASKIDGQSFELHNMFDSSITVQDGITGYQCWPHRMRGEGFFMAVLKKGNGESRQAADDLDSKTSLTVLRHRESEPWGTFVNLKGSSLFTDKRNGVHVLPSATAEKMLNIGRRLYGCKAGTYAGIMKGTDIVPSHELALSNCLAPDIPGIELDLEGALKYLRRDTLPPLSLAKGWYLATFKGLNLGWIKQAGKQTKNYFPIDWRIRKQQSKGASSD